MENSVFKVYKTNQLLVDLYDIVKFYYIICKGTFIKS